jgi:N-acyl-D-amino-acid deacylase
MHRLYVVIRDCYTDVQQREVFAHELCMPASDATALAPTGKLGESIFLGAYTWAAWYFRTLSRDGEILAAQEAVHRMTAMPAARLGLKGRGLLRAGACADVAIFDPRRFEECATEQEPNRVAQGVSHVLVNGDLTLADGELTGRRSGQVLRAGRALA